MTFWKRRLLGRFGFDSIESRKFLMFVKNKATVDASWVCFRTSLLY